MKKSISKVILSVALIVAGHVSAFADGIGRVSLVTKHDVADKELMTTLEPTFINEAVVGSPWENNWFVSAAAGTSVFAGSPLGCEDIFGRMKPAVQITAGKWFTPSIGVRAAYQGWEFKDADITTRKYHAAHADLLWNVVGMNSNDELGLHRWTVAPYVGGGIIKHEDSGHKPFMVNFGVMAAYRLNRRVSVNMELAGLNTFRDFDGRGADNKFGDGMYTLSAGLTVNIGKIGWKRAVDANPYRQQNEYLMDYINELLRDKGDAGSSTTREKNGRARQGDYSGLASLKARLAHKDWNGKGAVPSDDSAVPSDGGAVSGQTSDERKLIGVPFYFFFRYGLAELTDESQLQNLDNLAKVANAYNLQVYVEGAADSATGSEMYNGTLSGARAKFITRQLQQRGVPIERIHIKAKGGIDKFSPIQRNRHTRVMIKSLDSE